ncbi:MAG: S8 family serine peptidase [Acidobacteriota bacterium]|nr:S8 family serine peptidase [Acidobacteriota bacterium]
MGDDVATRAVVPFRLFTGFAADLTESEVASLRQSSEVRWVEPVRERQAFAQEHHPLRQTVPFGVQTVRALQAQRGTIKGVVNVVVVDTGIDYRHPELSGIWAGGRNILTNTDDPFDDDSHGTHVAGTIAAADNNIGVIGVAPNVRLWSVKVLNAQGKGSSEGLSQGLDWVAAKHEALGGNWIVNLSLGGYFESEAEKEAFQRMRDNGILVIAAAGNFSTGTKPSPVAFPGAYPSVVAVGATTFDGQLAPFSCQGPELDLAAPGVGVLSTLPLGTNDTWYVIDRDSPIFAEELIGSKRGAVSGDFVYCGAGKPEDFPASVAGKIALMRRGEEIPFADKTRRAKEAGAIAVAIFDNVEVPTSGQWTLYRTEEDRLYDWPITVRLSMQAGEALRAAGPHTISLTYTNENYAEKSGTSMACPHVVGAAALLWSMAPAATPAQIINALTVTATDLGAPGADPQFGAGMIDVYAAAKFLVPSAFSGITTGRPIGRRGGK